MTSPTYQSSPNAQHSKRPDLLPQDPYTAHSAYLDRSVDDVTQEKRAYTLVLQERAEEFAPGPNRDMALAAIELMHEFHYNQFRAGPSPRHSTNHTTAVALDAAEAAEIQLCKAPPIAMSTPEGEPLNPVAIAFVVGALHDSREDFFTNFLGTAREITPQRGAEIVEARIMEVLSPILGEAVASAIIEKIKILSLSNADEFPTRQYVSAIAADFISRCVKQADYDNNIRNFPDFTPTYPLVIVPAQYQPIVSDSPYEQRYSQGLILNLARFDSEEVIFWEPSLRERGIRTVEHLLDLFDRYNEPEAIERVRSFYGKLRADMAQGTYDGFLAERQLPREVILDKIDALVSLLEPALPEFLRERIPDPARERLPRKSESVMKNIPLRILGPMRFWGAEITFDSSEIERVQQIIKNTSDETAQRIPGYFTRPSDDSAVFHISRYPRRLNQPVPTVEQYQAVLSELETAFSSEGISFSTREENLSDTPRLRVVLGLEEGYYEGKKKEVLALVDEKKITNLPELLDSLTTLIGDYQSLGIDLSDANDFQAACEFVEASKVSILHTVEQARHFLGSRMQIDSAQIFSAAPEYATPYQEPAVVIVAPATKENFQKLVALAHDWKQARFPVENLTTGMVANVELSQFSKTASAARS